MHFQNIHIFIYQKTLLHTLLLLVFKMVESLQCILKDTHKKKSPSNKIPAFTKGINMNIWVAGTSKQLLISGS